MISMYLLKWDAKFLMKSSHNLLKGEKQVEIYSSGYVTDGFEILIH